MKPGTPKLLVVRNLWKRYAATGWVLREVDLEIGRGERVLILGSNGSGKTTLLRIIAGLARPTKGIVRIDGHPSHTVEARSRIGVVLDHILLYRDLTVRENLEYYASLYGIHGIELEKYWVIEKLGLRPFLERRVEELSFGWRRRADIARSLLHNPRLLLIDEAFTGLDEAGAVALSEILAEVTKRGSTVIVVSPQPLPSHLFPATQTYRISNGRLSPETYSSE